MRPRPKRGFWLTAFLLVAIILFAQDIPFLLIIKDELRTSAHPELMLYTGIAIDVLQILNLIAVCFWSKTGVVAYAAVPVIEQAVRLYQGRAMILTPMALGAILLVITILPYWRRMRWGLIRTTRADRPPPLPGAA